VTPYDIRQATSADVPAISAMTLAAYEIYLALLGRKPTPMDRNYDECVAAGQVWLLCEGEFPRGLIVLEDQLDEVLIYSIAVDPRFQSRGLGRKLLAFAERYAAHKALYRLRLCTSDKMHRNLAIYRAAGFLKIGTENLDLRESPTVVWMVKNLR
jgi:ribosomal protein S18 acetylase RimI-like enzyme